MQPGAKDRRVAAGLALLGAGSFAVTTWIWWRGGGLDPVLRDPLTPTLSEAYLTGLWSAHLMLLQVLLMARLPWLERAWGRVALTRWHRTLGFWSFWLMVVHVYLFALQRVLRDPEAKGRALWAVFVTERWMLIATVGTLLVVLVVVTSVERAVRRLRYESWHVVHLWAYVGIGLALPHELASADFGVGWVAAYWWVLYLVALGTVLWWRVASPLLVSRRHRLAVAAVAEGPGTVSVEVEGRDLPALGARGGDFLTWRFLSGRGALAGHPYSLSAAPGDRLRLTVGADSAEAGRLRELAVGTRVLVEGPFGALPGMRRRHPRLLLLAAGVGITPVLALLPDAQGPTTLLHRVHADPGPLAAEVAAAAGREHVVVLAGPRRSPASWLREGFDGTDADVLRDLVPDLPDCDVVVSGPPGWAALVRAALRETGVRRRDVHVEEFGWFS